MQSEELTLEKLKYEEESIYAYFMRQTSGLVDKPILLTINFLMIYFSCT